MNSTKELFPTYDMTLPPKINSDFFNNDEQEVKYSKHISSYFNDRFSQMQDNLTKYSNLNNNLDFSLIENYKENNSENNLENNTDNETQKSQLDKAKIISQKVDAKTDHQYQFKTKDEFFFALNNAFKNALIKFGKDPRLSVLLVAQNIYETGWRGESMKGYYNFGNITTLGDDYHLKSKDGKRKWKDFKSLSDYAEYKIRYLNGKRYNFYSWADLNHPDTTMQRLADLGYDRGSKNYGSTVGKIYKTLLQKYGNS